MKKDTSLQTLKEQVEYILSEYPATRNSDITLTIRLWKVFYHDFIVETKYNSEAIKLSDLYELPSQDGIKRWRATYQNTNGLYPPTDWKVAKRRGYEEAKWREAMRNNKTLF